MTATIRQTTTMKYGLRMEKRDISGSLRAVAGSSIGRGSTSSPGRNWLRLPTTTRSPSREPGDDLEPVARPRCRS